MGTLGSSPRAVGVQQLHLSFVICDGGQVVRNVIPNQTTFPVGKGELVQEISGIKKIPTWFMQKVRLDKYCDPSWPQLRSCASSHGVTRAGTS